MNLKEVINKIKASDDEAALDILRKAIDDEDLEGMSIVDDPNESLEDDAAAKFLAEAEGKQKEKPQRSSNWKGREDLSDEEKAAVEEHMGKGYSEREAHRLAGAHREHQDFSQAMRSNISPSMMSDKMIEQLKPLAKEWLENADKHEKRNAQIEKSPMKHASGKFLAAHEDATQDYRDKYHDHMNSDDIKDLSGRERFKKIREWKKEYRQNNPDYDSGITDVSGHSAAFDEARKFAAANLNEKMDHIARGGVSMPGMSTTEAAQHLGIGQTGEGTMPQMSTEDITSSFASKNPKLVELLNQEKFKEHKDRLQRVDSHANASGVVRKKKSEEQ